MKSPQTGMPAGTAPEERPDRAVRHGLAAVSVLLAGALLLTGCNGGSGSGSQISKAAAADAAAAKDASDAQITITPKDRSTNVGISNDADVTVNGGTLSQVVMAEVNTGKTVPGTMLAGNKAWKPDVQLDRSTAYRITASAKDAQGRAATANSTFTTVSPANSYIAYYTPDGGTTVGVGMPVSINFDKAISDKKAVESHITVTSTSGQQVVGHWFGSTRIDFRPQDYWKPNSTITLKLALDGVQGAPGITGIQNKTVAFSIGRSQISTVDARAQEMTVTRDGKVMRTIPISSGSAQHTTYNGQMVISEKYIQTEMNSTTVGLGGEYDIKDVPHAMRLTTSGTFIHGNYWGDPSIFGHDATSHGCVGMQDAKGAGDANTPAAWFYNNSLIGDVVIVKNSPDKTVAPDNGLNGWNISWSEWVAGSALNS